MRIVVTGGAGFIGSNLVDELLRNLHKVVVIDNFSTGCAENLKDAYRCGENLLSIVEADLLDYKKILPHFESTDLVIHLAANADVRNGPLHPRRDTEQNLLVTQNILEAMRNCGVPHVAFSSTGSVYGEANEFPTREESKFPVQTSLYGASKLGAEALLTAYSHAFGIRCDIFRFVSILGPRYSHGHVIDFFESLRVNESVLRVLGDGNQRKSYLHVKDCVAAINRVITDNTMSKINIFNLGTDEFCTVNQSIGWITNELGIKPKLEYTGGERGWVGDNPFIFLDTEKIRMTGWVPKFNIRDSILDTVSYLATRVAHGRS